MGKALPDEFYDAAFDWLDQSDKLVVCSSQPTTYAEANATYALADAALTPDTDFTKANGDVSGRKVTVAGKTAFTVDTSGTATHIAVIRTTDSTLRAVTTCTSQALTAGNTVTTPAFDIELADPT